jgi:tetratricopeptide (TPR) repeat protein
VQEQGLLVVREVDLDHTSTQLRGDVRHRGGERIGRKVVRHLEQASEGLQFTVDQDRTFDRGRWLPWLPSSLPAMSLSEFRTVRIDERGPFRRSQHYRAVPGAEAAGDPRRARSTPSDGTPSLDLGIAALRAVSGFHGVRSRLDAARRMLELLPDHASPWRQTACWALGYSLYLSGMTEEARAAAQEAIRIGRSSPVHTTTIRSLALLGLVEDDQGKAEEAEALAGRALELTETEELSESPAVGCMYMLYRKLGVSSRREAVALSRKLGLLP